MRRVVPAVTILAETVVAKLMAEEAVLGRMKMIFAEAIELKEVIDSAEAEKPCLPGTTPAESRSKPSSDPAATPRLVFWSDETTTEALEDTASWWITLAEKFPEKPKEVEREVFINLVDVSTAPIFTVEEGPIVFKHDPQTAAASSCSPAEADTTWVLVETTVAVEVTVTPIEDDSGVEVEEQDNPVAVQSSPTPLEAVAVTIVPEAGKTCTVGNVSRVREELSGVEVLVHLTAEDVQSIAAVAEAAAVVVVGL